ncbi:hypothetical protein IQ06DRAFT_295685 [Phaeosphaeriaceae sp. SRC1lsM3a]|nr:hypothetical protein IQ06DRAFT_295685 [Stagonospora sp. SRC1lsM3a]
MTLGTPKLQQEPCPQERTDDQHTKKENHGDPVHESHASAEGFVEPKGRASWSPKYNVAEGVRRLRRRISSVQDRMSYSHLHRPRITSHPWGANDVVAKTALPSRQASGQVKDQQQPSVQAPSHLTAHQLCLGANHGPSSNNCDDERQTGVVRENGVLGGVSQRSFETIVEQRHSAASPDHQHKPRSTYIITHEQATLASELDEIFRMHDNMETPLGATMQDVKSELEWLEPITTFNRNFGLGIEANSGGDNIEDMRQKSPTVLELIGAFPSVEAFGETHQTTDDDHKNINVFDFLVPGSESPPELDAGYQTSDSGMSIAEELVAEHLTPAQSMLDLLPTNMDGRFGSFYSVSNASRLPEPHILYGGMEYSYADASKHQSRFSWGSSVYSDAGMDSMSEVDVWWKTIKPKPLNIKKELPPPPPIPERNPLRLLRRLSKGVPTGFSESARASRNIHNLHLDLSRLSNGETRSSSRNSTNSSQRKVKRSAATKGTLKRACEETQPSLALPGHILDAMSRSPHRAEATHRLIKKKPRRSVRASNATSNSHSRSHSAQEPGGASNFAKQVMQARGHTRTVSEPIHVRDVRSRTTCRWNEAMPSDECIRRTCIAGLSNEARTRRMEPTLAINKQLPPLPVKMDASR